MHTFQMTGMYIYSSATAVIADRGVSRTENFLWT